MNSLAGLTGADAVWPAVAAAGLALGLANSAHCAGMCGAFALHATGGERRWAGFGAYGLGKLFAYLFLGTLAATLGAGLVASTAGWQSALALVAASALLLAGLRLLLGPRAGALGGGRWGGVFTRGISRLLGDLRRPDLPGGRFGLGVLTGLLPCGVVYLAVLQAAALAHPAAGLLFMLGFGLGTLPVLGATAWMGGLAWRRLGPQRLRLAGGLLLLVLGTLGAVRAGAALGADDPAAACPLCPAPLAAAAAAERPC